MKTWDKIKYAIFGDRPSLITGLRPIEAAAQRGDIEAVLYYKDHSSKQENADGDHIWEKVPLTMETAKSLLEHGIRPERKERFRNALTKIMFHDLESLTPENLLICRYAGVSRGATLPDGTTFFTQKGRSDEQKQIWIKHATSEQIGREFLSAANRDDITSMISLSVSGKLDKIDFLKLQDAFICAAYRGKAETLKLLYDTKKIDLEWTETNGRTAAWHACHNGRVEAAKFLAGLGAKLNHKDKWGNHPFTTQGSNYNVSKKVLQDLKQELLYQAIAQDKTDQVDQLVECGVNLATVGVRDSISSTKMHEHINDIVRKQKQLNSSDKVFSTSSVVAPKGRGR